MKLWLLGVRGSSPVSGVEFLGYGGRTSCVAISSDGVSAPDLILDAGTGLASVTALLGDEPFRGTVLLSHLHWDHVQGIPFFVAGDRGDSVVDLRLPSQHGLSGRDLLAKMMSPPSFPIGPEDLRGQWTFTASPPGPIDVTGYQVRAIEVAHKGGRTYGYRVETQTSSMAYLPDHASARNATDAVREFIHGVDVLIHDAQYLRSEGTTAESFGHSTVDEAIALAARAEVGTLVLFHHAPTRTDDALEALERELETGVASHAALRVVVAREGQIIDLRWR